MRTCSTCGTRWGDQPPSCPTCEDRAAKAAAVAPDTPPEACVACGGPLEERGIIPLRTHGPVENAVFFRQYREMAEKLWPVRVVCCSDCKRLDFYEATPDEGRSAQ
jgi:hypothetical protein